MQPISISCDDLDDRLFEITISNSLFLVPKGEIMMVATIKDDKVQILHKTLFPSKNKYAVSEGGLLACIDDFEKLIIYGNINEHGKIQNLKIIDYPNFITPSSLCIVNNDIVFSGKNNLWGKSHDIIAKFSVKSKEFNIIAINEKKTNHSISDLYFEKDKIFAIDETEPIRLIEFDFSNIESPKFLASYKLSFFSIGSEQRVAKMVMSSFFISFIVETTILPPIGRSIFLLKRSNYNLVIRLDSNCSNQNHVKKDIFLWNDIILIPNRKLLLISANEMGIGIYEINESRFNEEPIEDSRHIKYCNIWDKNVIKILQPFGLRNDLIVIFFQEVINNQELYSYMVENIENLLTYTMEDFEEYDLRKSDGIFKRYDSDEYAIDDEYCGACQESPCMCSDKEKTSLTWR